MNLSLKRVKFDAEVHRKETSREKLLPTAKQLYKYSTNMDHPHLAVTTFYYMRLDISPYGIEWLAKCNR